MYFREADGSKKLLWGLLDFIKPHLETLPKR